MPIVVQALSVEPILSSPYPALTDLKVDNGDIAASALQDIFTHCTNLRDVWLTNCINITDETIKLMTKNCHSLTSLNLMGCKSITIAGVQEIATRCSTLSILTLYGAPVSDDVMIQLSLHCTGLTRLTMMQCYGGPLTEAGVLAVVQGCTGLTFLSIQGNIVMPITPLLKCVQRRHVYKHIAFDLREGSQL